ncbi:hypothetical protein TWF506_010645 [Arthrobotrys conoides]|uniref:DUF3835 domain-containing protein n=1 Tax=Arthrobotrys conoides TaxID=74498 RepID=A0AAN8RVX0_9PEZI
MDTIEVTEKQRQQLEASVTKLRKALKHWQIQSAEYEGLKEELLSLPKTAGRDKILAIADDFGGDVVTKAEITSFLGDKEGIKRGPEQVAEAVRHRIDYIQENIDKIEKQLEIGEATLDNVRVIRNSGQLMNEEGLPVMDIREDLDEKGVVIKSDVNLAAGGSAKPFNVTAAIESFQPLVDTLSKKQKEKEKEKEKEPTKPQERSKTASSSAPKSKTSKPPTSENKAPSQDQIQQKPKPKVQPKTPKRIQSTEKEYSAQTGMVLTEKRVKAKLVPDLKEEAPQPAARDEVSVREIISAVPGPASYLNTPEQDKSGAPQKEGIARIRVLDDSDDDLDEDSEDPFNSLPTVEESEDDAQMREEMIKYNMREMNNIVAEIELEEGDEEDDDDDYDDEEDEEDDDEEDEDEDEDQWGRSKGRLVSNKVRREMMKLQKKIEARDKAAQVAAEVEADSKALASNTERNKEIIPLAEEPKKEKKKSSEKKGVRFAEELDIAPVPTPITKPPSNASELIGNEFDDEDIDPSILDMIFGPGTADQEARYFQNTTEQPKKKLPSLFRAARQIQKAKEQSAIEKAPPAISGVVEKAPPPPPPGSYEIIEREPSTTAPIAPKPSGKMPTRKSTPSKSAAKPNKKEPTPEPSTVLDPLGAELSDEDRPIMAASVIERAPTWEAPSTVERAPPTAPDELDPDFHHREVTNAYYSMRNKLIQRQGGYVETEEEKMEVPIDENLERKKVSRFKAGRVKNQLL